MSWLQVGKSFQEANATSLTVVDDADKSSDIHPSKRLREEQHKDEFDSSSSSDDEPVGPMLEFSVRPRMAKSVLEVTWSVDRRGDRSSFHFSAKRDEKEKGYSSDDSGSSQKPGSRSKKRRKICLETRSDQLPFEESREIFDKRWRYFGKHGRNTVLSLSSHRFKLRNRSQAGEKVADSPKAFLVAPQTEHLAPLLDLKENPDLFQIGVDPKCITSLQMEIMDEIRKWSSFFAEIRSMSQASDSNLQWPLLADALHSLQVIVHSLHHMVSGEFSTLSPTYMAIGSKIRLNQFDRALTEKVVELLKQRWVHYQTLENERIIAGDSLLSDIAMSLMHQEIHLHSSHEFILRLQTLLQELPWSWPLHDLRRRCLRNNYSSSSFKAIRDFETQFWSNLQAVIKNRSAARKLLHDLSAAPLTQEDPEEELLRSVEVQRKRIEHVAYFDRLLRGMGYEEHVVGHFQALMMIHLKELEVPGAAFVVREILQNWEGEIDLRLGEVSGMHAPSVDPLFSSSSLPPSSDYVSLMQLKVFPSKSLVLPMTVSYGPAPPESTAESSTPALPPQTSSSSSSSSNNASITSQFKDNEVVDGKVLVYSRVHGYKIWIPANAAAEDTTEIYRRVLSSVERDIYLPTINEPTKMTQQFASTNRDSMQKLPPIQRLVYPDAAEQSSAGVSLSYQPFLIRDLIRSKVEYLPLRAMGLSETDVDEAAAMRAMEEAEKFPERVVFSEDLKPLMFWIRDAPTASSSWSSSPELSSGILALPMLLIQLGPTALGLHMVSSIHYTTVEEELLALEPTMMEPTLPTFSILHHLLSITDDPLQPQQKHLWHGFLHHMNHQRSIRNPGFIHHDVLASHRLKGILLSRAKAAAAITSTKTAAYSPPTSRLEFAIQVIDQLIHQLVAFTHLPTTNQYSTSSRQWLATMITQLRRWLLNLFFTQCCIDCDVLKEGQSSLPTLSPSASKEAEASSSSSSSTLQQQMLLIEECRQRCRAVLESTVDTISTTTTTTPVSSCPAGDLSLWAFYLSIEKKLLDMQTPEADVMVRYLPLWKMADKLIKAIDPTSSPLMMARHQDRFFNGEMTLYATITMILIHVAVTHPTVQSLYVSTARDFLVQRAWCRWNREQTTNASHVASVLKALQVSSSDNHVKASKKKATSSKAEVFVSNPMMEQEAIVLWQQASQASLEEWIKQPAASMKPTLQDEPELVDILRCTSLLELLLMLRTQGGSQNSTTAYYCCGDASAALSRAITEIVATWKPSTTTTTTTTTKPTLEDHRRALLLRALHLDRVEQTTLFAVFTSSNTTVDASVPRLEQQQRHEYSLMDLLCARTLEILTVIPQDSFVLGSSLYWQYIGQGKGCFHPNGIHNGYRAMRQYWRDIHATRSMGPLDVHQRDPQASMAYLRIVGYHGNQLSLRERSFELGLELLRHRHVVHQTLKALQSDCNVLAAAVLPDWRTFFTDIIPHYRLMYETSSYDAEIQQQPIFKLTVPAVIESLQRIGTILEQIVSWPFSSDIPWVWRLYSHLYLSVGDVETAKKVGLRALAKCGWCKAMYVDMLGAFSARPAATMNDSVEDEEVKEKTKRDEELAAIARMMQSQGIFLRA